MNNSVNLDSAFLTAQAKAQGWEQKFLEMFNAPMILEEQTKAFLVMAPAERQALREIEPLLYEKLVANINRLARRLQQMRRPPQEGAY